MMSESIVSKTPFSATFFPLTSKLMIFHLSSSKADSSRISFATSFVPSSESESATINSTSGWGRISLIIDDSFLSTLEISFLIGRITHIFFSARETSLISGVLGLDELIIIQ